MEQRQPSYQAILERMLIGAASDADSMVSKGKANVVIDLRAEAAECSVDDPDVDCVHIPMLDAKEGQEEIVQKAINEAVRNYQSGKIVAFH